jgi:hypothetical protein
LSIGRAPAERAPPKRDLNEVIGHREKLLVRFAMQVTLQTLAKRKRYAVFAPVVCFHGNAGEESSWAWCDPVM